MSLCNTADQCQAYMPNNWKPGSMLARCQGQATVLCIQAGHVNGFSTVLMQSWGCKLADQARVFREHNMHTHIHTHMHAHTHIKCLYSPFHHTLGFTS